VDTLEPRPRLGRRKLKALGILLSMALIGFVALNLLPSQEISGKLSEDGKITLRPQSIWYRTLLISLCTSLFTISVYELASVTLQRSIWEGRKEFDQFFGDDASGCCGKSVIFLQADKIDALLEEYGVSGIKDKIDSQTKGRLFKAREWMNYFDTKGAKALIKKFRDLGLDSPQLVPVERAEEIRESHYVAEQTPFTITMGLGFSMQTDVLLRDACSGWMRVVYDDVYGDALELLYNFVPPKLNGLRSEAVEGEFRRLLPAGDWSLAKWIDDEPKAPVNDYAIILRHTELDDNGHRLLKFVLAGFTERGTAAAGEYLAQNWRALWLKYVKGEHNRKGFGDFLLVIEGPSHWKDDIKGWSESLPAIRPADLKRIAPKLDTPWVNRLNV
jgi:hypothetical protein